MEAVASDITVRGIFSGAAKTSFPGENLKMGTSELCRRTKFQLDRVSRDNDFIGWPPDSVR